MSQSLDQYTTQFVSQFITEIDQVRKDFKVKNIKCQPFQKLNINKSHSNVSLTKIKPILDHARYEAELDDKIVENMRKTKMNLSHYKSLHKKDILMQLEKGQLPKVQQLSQAELLTKVEQPPRAESFQSTKSIFFHPTRKTSQPQILHQVPSSLEKSKSNIRSFQSLLSPQRQKEQDPDYLLQSPVQNLRNFKIEPLSKYDEGQIQFYEQDQEYITKLTQGVQLIGYTRLADQDIQEWVPCEITKFDFSNKQFLINICSLEKQKWVSRSNLLFQDENKQLFDERFDKAKKNRINNLIQKSLNGKIVN